MAKTSVSNLPQEPYEVKNTLTSDGRLQHVRLDIGTGTAEEQVTAATGLPVSGVSYALRYDEGATYTYIGEAVPGSAEGSALWRIKRLTNTNNTIVWADGNSNFDNIWTNRAGASYS